MTRRRLASFVALTVLVPAVWFGASGTWRFGAIGLVMIWGEVAFGFVVDREAK